MTIRRGEDWGRAGSPPLDLAWFDNDHEAAAAYLGGAREIGVTGGDLARTLGVGRGSGGRESSVSFPIDVIELSDSGGGRVIALAHVVMRRSRWGWWRGPITALMNAQYIGRWDVAPRGHPNDGRVDSLEVGAEMTVRQRFLAVRRLPTGAHLPHPLIRTRSVTRTSLSVPKGARVEVDGREWISRCDSAESTVDAEVVPDALVVWIPGIR